MLPRPKRWQALPTLTVLRRFVLRDNVLMYFASPKEFTGFRDKPSGVVLLEECNVRAREGQAGSQIPFQFSLVHNNGEEAIVLGAEYEKEMLEWMQAVRTSRMCISDPEAAKQSEGERAAAAQMELDSAREKRSLSEDALRTIERDLEAVQTEHRQLESEKEKAEKELKVAAPAQLLPPPSSPPPRRPLACVRSVACWCRRRVRLLPVEHACCSPPLSSAAPRRS